VAACSQLSVRWMATSNSGAKLSQRTARLGRPQNRQSAKLFLQSSELVLPHPSPPGSGGRGTLTGSGKRRVGRVPIPTRGHTLWYSLYIRALWGRLSWTELDNVGSKKDDLSFITQ